MWEEEKWSQFDVFMQNYFFKKAKLLKELSKKGKNNEMINTGCWLGWVNDCSQDLVDYNHLECGQ